MTYQQIAYRCLDAFQEGKKIAIISENPIDELHKNKLALGICFYIDSLHIPVKQYEKLSVFFSNHSDGMYLTITPLDLIRKRETELTRDEIIATFDFRINFIINNLIPFCINLDSEQFWKI